MPPRPRHSISCLVKNVVATASFRMDLIAKNITVTATRPHLINTPSSSDVANSNDEGNCRPMQPSSRISQQRRVTSIHPPINLFSQHNIPKRSRPLHSRPRLHLYLPPVSPLPA